MNVLLKKSGFLTLFFGLILNLAFAQSGSIRGKVLDKETGDVLPGATVLLMQDSIIKNGAYADEDGEFEIYGIQPGTYDIVFKFIQMKDVMQSAVLIKGGEELTLDVKMESEEQTGIVIEAKVDQSSANQMITIKRKSDNLMDFVTREEFQRSGAGDAGSAMKQITSVTVENGGKYVFVRGLGDRYSKTMLNGSELPGLDPDRNTVQMDLFPSALIDNVIVYKNFTPDLPGSFTGGLVNINTKAFPEKLYIKFSTSLEYNTNASLNDDFLTYQTGEKDWLGFDDGTRDIPEIIRDHRPPTLNFTNADSARLLDKASESFQTKMYPQKEKSFLNNSHSLTIGNSTKVFGDQLGYIFSLSYRAKDNFYDDGQSARWKLVNHYDVAENLEEQMNFNDVQATEEVLWGGLATISYKFNQQHSLQFNYLHNQSGESSARYLSGGLPDDDPNLIFETRVLAYMERSMDAFQLTGEHTFDKLNKTKIDWIGSYTLSSQKEPDLRFFSNDYTVQGEDTIYDIQRNLYNPPSRYFRDMSENNYDARMNITVPFKNWNKKESKLKFGGAYTGKYREFNERRFEFTTSSSIPYNGNPDEYFSNENMGVTNIDTIYIPPQDTTVYIFSYGHYLKEATEPRNSYTGRQNILAAYAMTELPLSNKLRFIGGMRWEYTDSYVESNDTTLDVGQIKQLDLLPSVNFIYSVKDNMNIRTSWSRTVARPNFREMAPFASFEFVRDFVLVGNDSLMMTNINNFDLRWEWFTGAGEIISVSGYYKHFKNPIERIINTRAANTELSYRNVDEAVAYGFEVEVRKNLGFATEKLKDFSVSANVSFLWSRVDINQEELELIYTLNPYADSWRPMFGQSPYSANAELRYFNDSIGLNTSLNFNVFGPRLSTVSIGGTPDVYEQPAPSLNYFVSKRIFKNISLSFRARNILNPVFRRVHSFKDQEYVYSSYTSGRSFSLGVSYTFK